MGVLQQLETADPRPDVDADTVRVALVDPEAGVIEGLTGRGDGKVRKTRHFSGVFPFEEVLRIEAVDFRRDLAREVRGIELGDRADTVLAGEKTIPRGRRVQP